tara:strand:- start:1552 stop:2403 length:852 start_codon:yes stop_codon:yes gene_type:complete
MGKKKEARERTASELRDVAIRGLLGKLPGNWPIIADIGMHIMGPSTDAALEKGKQYLGDVVGGYWKRMGEEPARAVYDNLTEKKAPSATTKGLLRDADPFFNPLPPIQEKYPTKKGGEGTRWVAQEGGPKYGIHRKDDKYLEDAGWKRPFYENPEVTAGVVGATSAAAPLIAGGLALSAFAEGGKPRSSYSNSVDGYDLSDTGSRSSNEYNPSVESAREAARAKTELENLKHAHKKELIELRGEAGTPGVQGGSSGVGSSGISTDVDRFLSNVYGNRGTTKYF